MEDHLKNLFVCLEDTNYVEAEKSVLHLTSIFSNELPTNLIDSYILTLFNEKLGLLSFVNKAVPKKVFYGSVVKSLELIYTLINNFQSKFEAYIVNLVTSCKFIIQANTRSAEKQKALELLCLMLESNLKIENETVLIIYNVLKIRVKMQEPSKLVLEKLVVAIGVLVKRFSHIVPVEDEKEMLKYLLNLLFIEISAKGEKRSFPALAGLFLSISNYMFSFQDLQCVEKLYNFIKQFANPGNERIKIAYRAALNLLTNHISLFSKYIYADSKWWNNNLRYWLELGPEDCKVGTYTLDAFHIELSKLFVHKYEDKDKQLFCIMLNRFQEDVMETNIKGYKMRLSIKALGYFADACPKHITSNELSTLFINLIQRVEHLYIKNTNTDIDYLENLPDYIQTLSNYIKQLEELNEYHIISLQQVTILMIRVFPKLSKIYHNLVVDALVITMSCMKNCKTITLDDFLQSVIYQGVIWTCSHPLAIDAEITENTSYKTYLPLWRGLLQILNQIKYDRFNIDRNTRSIILTATFNELLKTLLVLINKLNLTTKIRDDTLGLTDPETILEAVQVNDFVIFVNVVDFYVDLLDTVDPEEFRKWILMFTNQILSKSLKYPLVSGFYKLLAADLKICDKLNYINESRVKKEHIHTFFESIRKFIEDMTHKMKQYKGDLQLACLQVILEAPVYIINAVNEDFASTFITLFDVGRSFLKIAYLGIDTLEKWFKFLPEEKMEPFLNKVLPSLDSYLRTHSIVGSVDTSSPLLKTRKTNKVLSKRRVLVETEPELLNLQRKILVFIAKLNSELCRSFVNPNLQSKSLVWSKTLHLKVILPYEDCTFNLYLDKILPRILELALYSSDRKTRFTACEMLHSSIMVILGTAVQMGQSSEMNPLLAKVANAVLYLACDVDTDIQGLYNPLMKQVLHWYSNPKQLGSTQTEIILDTLLEGISTPNNSTIRDISGVCIKEFVHWSRKQSTKKTFERSAYNIHYIIKRLKYFSLHPDPSKRLGAALIFNNIYTELREEDLIINKYWIDLLYIFINNLSMVQCQNFEENDCLIQVKFALDHLLRVFIEKETLFNKNASLDVRPIPSNLQGNLLKHVAEFLLQSTTSINISCREKSMDMFLKLAPLVRNYDATKFINENKILFFMAYEHDLKKTPKLSDCNGIDTVNKWFHSFLCVLDAHIYFLGAKYEGINSNILESNVYKYLDYYFQKVQLQPIKDLFKNNKNINITTSIKENYDYLKTLVTKKILQLTIVILENITYLNNISKIYFTQNLFHFLCNYIFDYQSLGYLKIDEDWNKNNDKILSLMSSNLPSSLTNAFVKIIKEYIANKSFIQISIKCNLIPQKQRSLVNGMLLLEKSALKQNMMLSSYSQGAINALFNELLEFKDDLLYVKKLPNTVQEYCDFKIQLALEDHNEFLSLSTFLVDTRIVKCVENHNSIKYGLYIFETFKQTIIKDLLKLNNFDTLMELLLTKLEMKDIYLIQLEVLKYCQQNIKDLNQQVIDTIIYVISKKWDDFLVFFNVNINTKITGIEFVEKLANLTKNCLRNSKVSTWVLSLIHDKCEELSEEQGLDFVNQVINLLGVLIGSEDFPIVGESLDKMKQNYFQNVTTTSKKIAASLTIKKLFDAANRSKNINILIQAFDLFITIENNIELDIIIHKTYLRNLNTQSQLTTLKLIYKQCLDNKYTYTQKINLTDNLCSFIRYSRFDAFENFYKAIIKEVVEKLEITACDENSFVNKILSYKLTEALFSRIDTTKFSTLECPITEVIFAGNVYSGKELLLKLTKLSMNVCKEEFTGNDELRELFRLYQCYAYNTLVSIMCNTQKEIDFYNCLFYRETKDKEDTLWCKLIDCNKVYSFEEDFDELPERKKILVNIRSELRRNVNLQTNEQSAQYIESQHLFNSTLNEDICKYDFTNITIRSQNEEENTVEIQTSDMEIEIESYDLCQHECMATVCGLIKHMFDNEISPAYDPVSNNLPKWIKDLRALLLKDVTNKNVKLFIARVVYNMRNILKMYSQWLIGPIIKIIIDGHAGNSLNSFVIDMIIMVLNEWQGTAFLPDETQYPSQLLKFIMENVFSENRSKFTYNLNILKVAVELWKNDVTIPYEFIMKELEAPVKSKKLEVGIQLSAILLANNLAPWGSLIKQFAKSLIKGFESTHRTVYKACAETLGLSLKVIANNEEFKPQLINFKKLVSDKLNIISDSSKLAYCLEGLVNFYPEIADDFISKITYKMNGVVANFKAIYLRIILARIEKFHEINGLLKIYILELLSDVNVDVQIITLEIILKSVNVLSITQLQPILKKVCTFINNNNITSRNITYDILISVYNKYNLSDDELCTDIISLCKDFLLQALCENEPEIEEKIINFWSKNEHIPKEMHERFLYMLENMYKVSIEEIYLAYTTYLLLNKLKETTKFSDKIFDYPLHECEFKDYEVSTHWRTQHSSIRPMFASSLYSQDSQSINNVLKATQSSFNFEPTQSYVETQRSDYLKNTSSSLLFSTNEESGATFKDPNNVAISQKYKIYNRRFYKDKSKNSKFFAYQEVKKNTKREELRKDLAKKKEVDITVYRKYRAGDFPDIEISLSGIIVPLQVLAKLDSQIAKSLFISLFDNVLEKASDPTIFISKVCSSFNDIFKTSIQCTPTLISTLLEIALKHKKSMQFHPNVISTVCQCSGLMSIGSLLLEEYIITGVSNIGSSSTKRGLAGENDYEITHWIKLAELYKEMEDWDIVRAIFLEKLNCNETVLTAIEAESVGSWKEAKEYYSNVIQTEDDVDKNDFYYESYFKCFAELSDWDNLSKSIQETLGTENSWEKMWDQDWNQQKILPWYLTSQIRNALTKSNLKKELLTNINNTLTDNSKSEYLKTNFSEELAFLAILNNDTTTSKVYLETYITNFLENWGHINPLFSLLRAKKITSMRNALDIYIFIKEHNKLQPDSYYNIIKTIECFWDKSSIENVSSIIQIETKNIYRNQFINLFKLTLRGMLNEEDYSETVNYLDTIKFKLDMNLIDCAFNAKNFYVAKKHMQTNGGLVKLDTNNSSQLYLSKYLKYNLALSKTFLLRGQQRSDEQQKYFIEALKLTENCLKNSHLKSDSLGLLNTVNHLYNLTQEISKCDENSFDKNKLETIITSYAIATPKDVESYGFNLIKNTLLDCEKHEIVSDLLRKNMAGTFLKLAYYTQSKGDEEQMIYYTFKSMFYNSSEGRLLFPNLLNFENLGTTHKSLFIEQSSQVPIWMFIKWIPQLLSNLDCSKIFAISHIIINIAKEYPNSIIYAYRLSKEKYVFENNDLGQFSKEICNQLDVLLKLDNVLTNTLLSSLSSISLFTNILKSALQKLKKSCLKTEQIFRDDAKVICDDLFGLKYNYRDSESVRGLSFKRIDKYMESFLKMLKDKFNQKKIKEKIDAIYLELDKIDQTEMKKPNKDLGFYSPWLKNYHSTDEEMEIPGQYKGNQRPLTQYHVKIAGFVSEVRVFKSLRKPIQITVIGNDTKEYKFLVKYGEDLRQDQRIEQLFNLMNGILNNNPECSQRKLNIATYEVIPLTSKLGIIEWVEETAILKDFIKEGLSSTKAKSEFANLGEEFFGWISKSAPKGSSITTIYAALMLKFNNDEVIAKYRSFVSSVPWDAFRKSFWNISADPESFFALRYKFISSYAVMCISNWLLGIGDRHLSNILISTENGNAIGIDFGHAFGTATQILGIPELVPFRLTPQIINLMQPYNEHGLLQESMIHALRALRENSNTLLATMNVFVQEPSLDWLEFADSLRDESGDDEWYPKQKMDLATKKFNGANPSHIMIEELKTRKKDNKFLNQKYVEFVRGYEQHNIRARKGDVLSVEEQVKCLLDQATDYNLLGRMYLGWEPYI